MNYSLLAKVAIAGAVLTGVTGTAAMGNIVGVNQEAKAEVENPNQHHFKKEVDGRTLDFSETLLKNELSAKKLADEIKNKLEENGLDPTKYEFKFEVEKNGGGTIKGGPTPVVGNHLDNQTEPFNPNKDTLKVFEITKS